MTDLCPEVVEHFTRFPYFANFSMLPVMTTMYAAHSVCSVSIASSIASKVNAKMYLHAGSHLGAIIHGGPIPFDDDVDLFLEFSKKDAFLQKCETLAEYYLGVALKCVVYVNSIKLSVIAEGSQKTWRGWYSPFVDIFLFRAQDGLFVEVSPQGHRRPYSFHIEDYFPTRPFYFGGLQIVGPKEVVSAKRYRLDICKVSTYDHRNEKWVVFNGSMEVDCCHLSKHLPFVYENSYLFNGKHIRRVMNPSAFDSTFANQTWYTSFEQRKAWYNVEASEGSRLSNLLPNSSVVEVENGLSTCSSKHDVVVVEFNMERGSHWLDSVDILKKLNADVIILNEMDIGMARSDQQHTTRLLAFAMNMNYAWGLEFLELTRGTREEQESTSGIYNFLGLHGNAILSKCELRDPVIFRDKIGDYFSSKPNSINANGYERRLGGRMGLFMRMSMGESLIVVGSVHKINGYRNEIKEYIGSSPAVIAGDQSWGFCENVALFHVDNKTHATWPASCSTSGSHRGDIICSNMNVLRGEKTIIPCNTKQGTKISLSDHAISIVVLSIN